MAAAMRQRHRSSSAPARAAHSLRSSQAMRAENYFSANRDLSFYYDKVIDWDRLVPLFAPADEAALPLQTASSWRDVLDVAGDYAGRQISARAAEVDRLGTPHTGDIKVSPPMAENLRGLAAMGLVGLGIPREYG